MKVAIIRLALNHLRNAEYCQFINIIVSIVSKYQPETLHLQRSFERLTAFMPQIAEIKAQEQSNIISKQLSAMNAERRTLIKSVFKQVKTFSKLSIDGTAEHVAVLNRFLNKHGSDIGTTNYNDSTKRFKDLLDDYHTNAEISTAASALQLVLLFNHLATINAQFDNLFIQRIMESSMVETVDARAIRKEVDKVLIAFFDAFEVFSMEYDQLNYQTPANEINEFISHTKAQLKARTTRSKKRRNTQPEEPTTEE